MAVILKQDYIVFMPAFPMAAPSDERTEDPILYFIYLEISYDERE